MPSTEIRPGTPADLPALVAVWNASRPDIPTTLAMSEFRERTRKPELPFGRLVAQHKGRVVGMAYYVQPEWSGEVGKFWVAVTVHPAARRQGVGAALYEAIHAEMQSHGPQKLNCMVREDRPDALQFAASRGFAEIAREQDAELDLVHLNVEQRGGSFSRAQADGYELTTFAEVIGQIGADEAWKKYYALDCDAGRDVPLAPGDTLNMPTLERYREQVEGNPNFDPSLCFLASRDGQLAALSELRTSVVPDRLDTGFTGVAREHRGHRLAWALKYLALEEAIRRGAKAVRTSNDETNVPMRNINTGLGFVPIPAYLTMSLTLKS